MVLLGPRKQVPATQCRVTWRHRACPGQIALFLNFFHFLLTWQCDGSVGPTVNTFKTPVDPGQGSYPEPQCHCGAYHHTPSLMIPPL